MRAIWKGSISFGLVSIPVALHNATRQEELKFRLLRRADLSPVNYKRVAQVDGKEVPWDDIVKGYEYEKGKYVVLKDEDFKRVDLEATDTIDIQDFVALDEINPMYFYKPYYLEPLKGGASAYELLRKVLCETKKVGIAKVIVRTRQHLAAVKCNGNHLVLELMRFKNELMSALELKPPPQSSKNKRPAPREFSMAIALVNQMTTPWNPARYQDEYRSALKKVIDKKVAAGGKTLPESETRKGRPATAPLDLADVLRRSLAGAADGKNSRTTKRNGTSRTPKPTNRLRLTTPQKTKRRATTWHKAARN